MDKADDAKTFLGTKISKKRHGGANPTTHLYRVTH